MTSVWFAGIHARLDDLHGNLAANRLKLLGGTDDTEPPLTEWLAKLVSANQLANLFTLAVEEADRWLSVLERAVTRAEGC